jgi:hypothetical protein
MMFMTATNMAQDIWNMLKAKGINARIAVGYY